MFVLNSEVSLLNILSWIVFGFIAGLIIHALEADPTKVSLAATILFGIIGAVVGGFLANLILAIPINQFSLQSFFIAVIGASFFLLIQQAFIPAQGHIKTKVTRLK